MKPQAGEWARLLGALPTPAVLQDASFRLIQVNEAWAGLVGRRRAALVGHDSSDFEPPEDREGSLAQRAELQAAADHGQPLPPGLRRLVDGQGTRRWFTVLHSAVAAPRGEPQWLSVWQESSAEVAAREQSRRAYAELGQWFDLSGSGMLIYDATGLIVRCNTAFEALVDRVPEVVGDAPLELQALLGWHQGAMLPALAPGALPLECQALVPMTDGRRRRLSARLACHVDEGGARRVMAVVQDRSAEDERDLAQLEMGMLMDTASIGVATYDPQRGWLAASPLPKGAPKTGGGEKGSSTLLGIGRELVEPDSLPEFERLQRALRGGERTEVRYAVRHPELGSRWLLTRVEPGALAGGRATTSVVTLDVTDQQRAQHRNEQLLRDRELMFSLSEVGIVYQRGSRIERANQAMAELTGWASTELGTLDPAELYESARDCVDFEARINQGLREHHRFSGERRLRRRDGSLVWVQVAVRPVQPELGDDGAGGVICSFVDIDERRRAREVLAAQAERTRSILNSVLVGIVTVSAQGIQWMNRSARRMFGGELADFVGEPMSIVATPEPDHPLRHIERLGRLKQGQAETFECRLKARDGREFWVVGNAVITGHGEAGDELTIALLDIERRRQAEISIAQAKASLQRVIETAPLAIALFDAQTLHVRQLNHTAASFFGRPLEQLQGASLDNATAPALASSLDAWLRQAQAAGQTQEHEWREAAEAGAAPTDSGAVSQAKARVWDCRIAPLDDGGPGGAQLLLVASDVTGQRVAERARLQAAIDQRELLVREVHHRIKNNLQGVAGLLQQGAVRHPELATVLSEAVGQVQAIAQVYGLQVGASGPLEVAGLLQAIARSVQRTFGRTIQVSIVGSVPHRLPEAESIPVALTLNELLTNAIKHGSGADVACVLAAEGDGVQIRIANAGSLTAGFDIDQVRGGVSGLGLVRALLPRRSATLTLTQHGPEVVAMVELRPPGVHVPALA